MAHHQPLVPEDGDSSDGMQILRVEKTHELWQIADRRMVSSDQGIFKRNVDASVAVLNIENHGISAHFTPVPDDSQAMVATRHQPGEIDGADLKVLLYGDGFF